jgi:hypothetical protein
MMFRSICRIAAQLIRFSYVPMTNELRLRQRTFVCTWSERYSVKTGGALSLVAEGWTTLPFAFSNTGRLDTERTVRGSNPGAGEVFRTRPDRPWGPPSLLYNGYRVSFPGVKRPGRGLNHPPSSIEEIKEIVELYFCSPSGLLSPVLRKSFTFTFTF